MCLLSNIKSNKVRQDYYTFYTLVHTEEEGRRRTNENPIRQRLLLGRRRGGGGHFCFSHGIWDIWLPWEEEDIFDLAMEFGIFGYHGTVLESLQLFH